VSSVERITVTGVVQGVGFRPFVHRLATEVGLNGFVGNTSTHVFIEIDGTAEQLDHFTRRLVGEAPPLARIDGVERTPVERSVPPGFHIAESARAAGERTLVAPDSAVCDDCLREFRDPGDRRHRHPFITCTNCGPRFTIIRHLPYDRSATTMAGFAMCQACAAEYADPNDRRYHAQPIGCHDCGPTMRLDAVDGTGDVFADGAVAAVELFANGRTVAIKGLGGFHLACDASCDDAVGQIRRRKHRPDKPFAVMVPDIETATRLAEVSEAEAAQLSSLARPIVLLRSRGAELSALVAPDNPLIGLMLPSTPIHHLLFDLGAPRLVMTSANACGEPLVHRDDEARDRLSGLCDAILTHDRPILAPCDDSVVRVAGGRLLPIRRARGFAPLPVPVGAGRRTVLAVGAELKNAFCLASRDHAWMSAHIGDMENLATLEAFERSTDQFQRLYDVRPDVVAVDAHPGYSTSSWARRVHGERVVEVQHHHAHVAAVMAEHELDPHRPVIGVAFDGTGYGLDGTIWGGELLIADADGFERFAHLRPVPLPGGDAAIRHPHRVALAQLRSAAIDWAEDLPPVQQLTPTERSLLDRQLERGVACVPTTSMGRLFDAVASLVGLRHTVSFEAQAAIDLEIAAERATSTIEPYAFGRDAAADRNVDPGADLLDQRPVLQAIVRDLRAGVPVESIALAFHHGVADAVCAAAVSVRDQRGLDVVALSGGVFQNAKLTELCAAVLHASDFDCLTHHLVPPNDGGIALGQAFVAAHRRVDTIIASASPTRSPTAPPTSREN
jgi:hydrogenase maturation protein HypF